MWKLIYIELREWIQFFESCVGSIDLEMVWTEEKKNIYIYIVLLILFKWIRGHTLFIDKVTHVQKMCKMNSYNCSKKTQLFEGIINVFINKEFGQTGPNPHGSV